ncbi:MAG: metal-sulfur cluster assembly factor [Burkholderiales bacterium]|nr:metal-sulfur cluster assembly factor [Burkholderiales bacterium]
MASDPVPDSAVVWAALETVFDPEIGENVVDLGLVYRVECAPARVEVDMTMTTPACPAAGSIAADAEEAIRRDCPQAREVTVAVVFEPPWAPERMSEPMRKRFGW